MVKGSSIGLANDVDKLPPVESDIQNACTGVGYSDDKLLQTRIFSYADTQRHRLGPNYLLLPANAPKGPHHNNHHDGFMNFTHRDEEVRVL